MIDAQHLESNAAFQLRHLLEKALQEIVCTLLLSFLCCMRRYPLGVWGKETVTSAGSDTAVHPSPELMDITSSRKRKDIWDAVDAVESAVMRACLMAGTPTRACMFALM